MLNFEKITLENIIENKKYFTYKKSRMCDQTPLIVYMWRNFFHNYICIDNDMVFLKAEYKNKTVYALPFGSGDINRALDSLDKHLKESNLPLTFCNVKENELDFLKSRYGQDIKITFNRDYSDYLYDADKMRSYEGKAYKGQRNHLNRFRKDNPTYKFCPITKDNIGKVADFYNYYCENFPKSSQGAKDEAETVLDYITHFFDFSELFGGFIEIDGNIIAFSFGEVFGDTLYVHVERALRSYSGSYQAIVHEFANHAYSIYPEIKFINREEDCGDEGLRKSKLSYHPIRMIDKYRVEIN